jgi:hypothetical protein
MTTCHVTVSDSRLPQPGGPGPHIYIPQEQGGPVIPQALGSIFVASYDSQGYDGGRGRIHLAQYRDQCRALVNTEINLWVSYKVANLSKRPFTSQGLCTMELVS